MIVVWSAFAAANGLTARRGALARTSAASLERAHYGPTSFHKET
jgi:hypothetical protein